MIIIPFSLLQSQTAYSDANSTISILKGSGDDWTYTGTWNDAGQTWLSSGKVSSPSSTASAERNLGEFAGTSKYIYIMWHKSGPYRPDAARYKVYDSSGDKYNGTVNQTLHADNVNHGDDTFSGWYLLGTKKIDITADTKIMFSQDAPVDISFEYMQNDAIMLSDFPIVDNTSLGAVSDFEINPVMSVGSDGEQGLGHHWGMQGLGYQYTVMDGKSFTVKLDPTVYTDLLEEDYVVEISWNYLDINNLNVTNAKYSVNGTQTNNEVNQNLQASNQNGSFVGGNTFGSWSGFYRLNGEFAHTSTNPLVVSTSYNTASFSGKRLVFDMIRFVPVSQQATLSTKTFDTLKNVGVRLSNYPNPFKNETTLSYSLPSSGKVSMKIYNSNGVCVSNILNENKEKGKHKINFKNQNLSPGFYYSLLTFNGRTVSNKMIVF